MTINLKSRHLWEWVADNSTDPGEPDDPITAWRVTAKLMLEDSRKMEEIHQADLIRDMELTGRLEEANARIAELEAELERVAQGAADVAWERLKLERQLAEAKRYELVDILNIDAKHKGLIAKYWAKIISQWQMATGTHEVLRLCRQVDSVPAIDGQGDSQEG